jgi:hypothetical protein
MCVHVCVCVYVCVRAGVSDQVHHVRPRGQIPTQKANHMRRGGASHAWLCGDKSRLRLPIFPVSPFCPDPRPRKRHIHITRRGLRDLIKSEKEVRCASAPQRGSSRALTDDCGAEPKSKLGTSSEGLAESRQRVSRETFLSIPLMVSAGKTRAQFHEA